MKASIDEKFIVGLGFLACFVFGLIAGLGIGIGWGSESERTELVPLGMPEVREVTTEQSQTTLEYRVPTYEVWTCPKHGKTVRVLFLRGEHYCEQCLWERVLDDAS